jgi:hypothetical protein
MLRMWLRVQRGARLALASREEAEFVTADTPGVVKDQENGPDDV